MQDFYQTDASALNRQQSSSLASMNILPNLQSDHPFSLDAYCGKIGLEEVNYEELFKFDTHGDMFDYSFEDKTYDLKLFRSSIEAPQYES